MTGFSVTGVPSMVATWAKAVSLYGRDSLAADLQPAIGVAERGFRVNADFVQLTRSDLPELQAYPASRYSASARLADRRSSRRSCRSS